MGTGFFPFPSVFTLLKKIVIFCFLNIKPFDILNNGECTNTEQNTQETPYDLTRCVSKWVGLKLRKSSFLSIKVILKYIIYK